MTGKKVSFTKKNWIWELEKKESIDISDFPTYLGTNAPERGKMECCKLLSKALDSTQYLCYVVTGQRSNI